MSTALGIGPRLAFEVDRNRTLGSSPTMPAIERYTGVLFDALDAASLSPAGAAGARECVVIHSALFGTIRASDPIPAYRLSYDSRLSDVRLGALWAAPISRELDAIAGLIVDMRSEAYVALGPIPAGENRVFLRVVADGADGTRRAVTHFNKRGKGLLARAIIEAGEEHADVGSLLDWANRAGVPLVQRTPGEVELTIDAALGFRSV